MAFFFYLSLHNLKDTVRTSIRTSKNQVFRTQLNLRCNNIRWFFCAHTKFYKYRRNDDRFSEKNDQADKVH